MPTRNVVLTAPQSQFVDECVASGEYQNASEVLRDGLRILEQNKREYETRLQALRTMVQDGWDAYSRGEYIEVPLDNTADHLAERGRAAIARVEAARLAAALQ